MAYGSGQRLDRRGGVGSCLLGDLPDREALAVEVDDEAVLLLARWAILGVTYVSHDVGARFRVNVVAGGVIVLVALARSVRVVNSVSLQFLTEHQQRPPVVRVELA